LSGGYVLLNNYLLGPLLGSVKFVLLVLWLLIWFSLVWVCVSIFGVSWSVLRVIDLFFGKISLVLMSFYRTGVRRRMMIRSAIPALARQYENFSLHSERSTSSSMIPVTADDWIISNLSSYCDLIYNWYWYSGVVGVVVDGRAVRICSNRFKVFYYLFLSDSQAAKRLDSYPLLGSDASCYPVIIFPEGVSSNGRGVLKFIADLRSAKRNQRIHLVSTKYQSALFNPTYPGPPSLSSFMRHLWCLCSQFENSIVSRTILPMSLLASNFDLPLAEENPEQFNRTLQQIVAALGHLRPLTLQSSDKASFMKSFREQD
jgi:1-acylglycerol-3-phosphate O-acyltransferase